MSITEFFNGSPIPFSLAVGPNWQYDNSAPDFTVHNVVVSPNFNVDSSYSPACSPRDCGAAGNAGFTR
jgi:hypothetical protein